MTKKYLLGYDLGTTSAEGILVDLEGNIVASEVRDHQIIRPKPGWAEQTPEKLWWPEFINIINKLIDSSDIDPGQILAVGITGLVPAMCAVDEKGNGIGNAIFHIDNRAYKQLKRINKIFDESINLECVLPKLLWFKENQPEKYKKTARVLNPHSFLVNKLTGEFSCDIDTASVFGGLFDIEKLKWKKDKCKDVGIDPNLLPRPYSADSVVGNITSEAEKLTGLKTGTPVIAGSGDSFTSLLGTGVISRGEMMIYLGTSGTQILLNRDLIDLVDTVHFNSNKAEFLAKVLSCGESLEYFKDLIDFKGWDSLNEKAEEIPVGTKGLMVFPYLRGKRAPDYNPLARGSIFGLTPNHSKYHIYRAILEGISCIFKKGIKSTDSKVKRIVVCGGGAKSKVFRQIISDFLDAPVEYTAKGKTALGVAYLAGYGIQEFTDFNPINDYWLTNKDVLSPLSENVNYYKTYYEKYNKMEKQFSDYYQDIQNI